MKLKKSILLLSLLSGVPLAHGTEISNIPVDSQNAAKPNMIFALDDSGSLDFEVLLQTNDGELWWNRDKKSFIDNQNKHYFNGKGNGGWDGNDYWYRYSYLFPNGTGSGARKYSDGSTGFFAVPPIPKYNYLRSSDYNPVYYNPNTEYTPWSPAYINSTVTFGNANPLAARSHPYFPTSGYGAVMNLTAIQNSTANNHTFRMLGGMVIPGNTISGIRARKVGNNQWQNINSDFTIPNKQSWEVAIPYYPATYFIKDNNCSGGEPVCITAPDGQKLRRIEIKPNTVFPSGRSYTAELQNFANWFQYYRKRNLTLNASVGKVLPKIQGVRGGIIRFKNRTSVSMRDFDSEVASQNFQKILGTVYTNPTSGGTPTRDALKYIGDQYRYNHNIIQHACQVNAAMVLTDGFASASGPSVPSYSQVTWGDTAPYKITRSRTLSDIALAYYTLNLRPDLPAGLVPTDMDNSKQNPDKNPNLHMNTFALTMGTKGTIFGTGTPSALDPFLNPPVWPNPNQTNSPTSVDDLWHATINGRGKMFSAVSPDEIVASIQDVFDAVMQRAGGAIAVSNTHIMDNDNSAYVTSYMGDYGDLVSLLVDVTTGIVQTENPAWSAQKLLDQRTHGSRKIASYNGVDGIKFRWSQFTSQMKNELHSPNKSDGKEVFRYIRGKRTLEGIDYRKRLHLLGDTVNAEPVVVKGAKADYGSATYHTFKNQIQNRTPIIYQGANDGMLHAFNANTGREEWAYIPKLVFSKLNDFAQKSYTHQFYVNSTPTVGDVEFNSGWKTILVGGLGAGGKGYYGLDITEPTASNENNLKNKVLWEFPNNSTPNTIKNNIGLSFGKPILAKTKAAGWVALVTSGYNNTNGDGKGHLFVLNPENGNLIKELVTDSGTPSNPSGLAQISAFTQNPKTNPETDSVYGGDLNGNLWRFDLSSNDMNNWNVKKIAELKDKNGNPQPITIKPELAQTVANRLIFVGTGQFLGINDLSTNNQNSFYGIVDDRSAEPFINNLRDNLVERKIINNQSTGNKIDYMQKKGWYMDFPELGERSNTTPKIAYGLLVFDTNLPSPLACASSSYQYIIDFANGLQMADESFTNETPWARKSIAPSFTTQPVLVLLPNGKLVSIFHNVDHTIVSQEIPIPLAGRIKKVAWKEVVTI